ncbi:hypothetical protein J2X04_001336 [Lysobacter niabensis]|uniref:Uncharacterized protein n=1 Tax=Agrilutibacter niabensis TaxID=380628 RepID=A0ABU1VNE2_9GAMM|nr:hypothetical protein [Lysobacter niabensis]MDR7098989.1 hypothetical protein [Lysobacter niabensis]
MPEGGDIDLAQMLLDMEPLLRKYLAFHIDRIKLQALESSASRLSVLPNDAAVCVVELRSFLSYLHQAGQALASQSKPPASFYPSFRQNVRECLASATKARALLLAIGFPDGRPTLALAEAEDAMCRESEAPEATQA